MSSQELWQPLQRPVAMGEEWIVAAHGRGSEGFA